MMFGSTCTAAALLDGVIEELALLTPPSRTALRDALNECLTRLYTEIIREERRAYATPNGLRVMLASLSTPSGCASVREEDISSAWSGDRQLRFLPPTMLSLGGTGYYTLQDGALILSDAADGDRLAIDYIARPLRFTAENEDDTIPFPEEFLSLLRCRVRGEGCRLAGEDTAAAKWLGEYNTALSEFRLWYVATLAERGR